MNFRSRYLLLIILFYGLSISAFGATCSRITIDRSAQDNHFYELHTNNYRRVGYLNSPEPLILKSGDHIELESGEHTLSFRQWTPVEYTRVAKERRSFHIVKQLPLIDFSLDFEAGFQYDLSISKENRISISSKRPIDAKCQENIERFLPAKSNEYFTEKLPSHLVYALYVAMYEYQHSQNTIKQGYMPLSILDYFGGIVDSKYRNNNQLRVLAVTPFSLASDIGLKAGDYLTKLGNNKVSDSEVNGKLMLTNYISQQPFGAEISFEVIRNGKVIKLEGNYIPVIMPELKFGLSKFDKNPLFFPAEFDKQVAKRFQSALIELSLLYGKEATGLFNIELPAIEDPKYGVSGDIVWDNNGFGFVVSNVSNNSPAAALGLRKRDIISKINSNTIKSHNMSELSLQFLKLENNKPYSILIVRNGKKQLLKSIMKRRILPLVSLKIDFESHHDVLSSIASVINSERAKLGRRSWLNYHLNKTRAVHPE